MRALLAALLLTACGGATTGEPCNQDVALAEYRAAHGETSAVGEWVITRDCVVTEISKPK